MNEVNEGCPALSKPEHMARAANRLRQRLRPEDPKDLDFDIMEDCIPQGFFQAEVYVKERRHLIFATDEQLTIRAGGQCRLQFYLLIELLHREARLTSITIKLVSDKKLKRIQRRKYRQLQQKLFDAWEQYQTGNKSASQLLRCCSHLNGPARCQ